MTQPQPPDPTKLIQGAPQMPPRPAMPAAAGNMLDPAVRDAIRQAVHEAMADAMKNMMTQMMQMRGNMAGAAGAAGAPPVPPMPVQAAAAPIPPSSPAAAPPAPPPPAAAAGTHRAGPFAHGDLPLDFVVPNVLQDTGRHRGSGQRSFYFLPQGAPQDTVIGDPRNFKPPTAFGTPMSNAPSPTAPPADGKHPPGG